MSAKRLFMLFAIIMLVLMAAFAVRQVAAKTGHVADRSYDSIEQLRSSLDRPIASRPSNICPEAECEYPLPNGVWVR